MERAQPAAMERLKSLFPIMYGDGVEYKAQPVNPETGNRLSSRLVQWIKESIGMHYTAESYLVNLCWPNIEYQDSRLMVKLWLNEADREKGISARRVLKPGKALKHLFPWMTDKQVESWVDLMREQLGERHYTLHVARDADSFLLAYTGNQCHMENPNTTSFRKSLANSCMRYDHIKHQDDNMESRHPVEAYASGDFEIAYITDQKGHVAARCVIYRPECEESIRPVAAPIYGVCENSMNLIQSYLNSINALYDFAGSWEGARLDKIDARRGGYIAPYLDLSPQRLTVDCRGFLIVDRGGEIDASSYGGILNGEDLSECENCGNRYDPEDEGGVVDDQHCCDSCYSESYFCEYYDEHTFQDGDNVNLWTESRVVTQWWSQHALGNEAEYIEHEYWRRDDCYQDYQGNYISPKQVDDGEYFISDWDEGFYPIDQVCETEEGEVVSKLELDQDSGIWEQGSNGIWYNVQLELKLETEEQEQAA